MNAFTAALPVSPSSSPRTAAWPAIDASDAPNIKKLMLVLRALHGLATYALDETDDGMPFVIVTHGHSGCSFIEPVESGGWVVLGALATAPTPLRAATAGAACLELAKLIVGEHAALLGLLQDMLDRVD